MSDDKPFNEKTTVTDKLGQVATILASVSSAAPDLPRYFIEAAGKLIFEISAQLDSQGVLIHEDVLEAAKEFARSGAAGAMKIKKEMGELNEACKDELNEACKSIMSDPVAAKKVSSMLVDLVEKFAAAEKAEKLQQQQVQNN